jgi:spore coat protein H
MHRGFPITLILLGSTLVAACTESNGGGEGTDETPYIAQPRSVPEQTCLPVAGGPYWLLEGESVTVTVLCASGMSLADAAIEVDELPSGAEWDPASGVLEWTTSLDQAAVWEIAFHATRTSETALAKIGVAEAWENPHNVPVVDPLRYTEEFGLPVFFLSPVPPNKDYLAASVTHGGHVYSAEAKVRGAASLDYPKLSYTLKFTKEDKFQEPSRSFVDKRKINLHCGFDDNSHLRNRMSFETWNRMDPDHIQMQSYSAVLYLNGEYWGLYTVIDHIDGFFMEDQGYNQEGDIFKATDPEANFSLFYGGSAKATPHDGVEKTEGMPLEGEPEAFRDLDDLVRFVEHADDATFRAQIGNELDLRDYQDWWILSVLVFANDSVNKNSYHYHDTGPFRFIPWDYNASFGQNWRTVRRDADVENEFTDVNRLFERLVLDPVMRAPLDDRYADILAERVPIAEMLARFDEMAEEIEISAKRDERKWGNQYRSFFRWADRNDFLTWEEEVAFVRAWMETRWAVEDARVQARRGE